MLFSLLAQALAHGPGFGLVAVSPAPDDALTLWAVVEGWGLLRSDDAGASWTWRCEEAFAASDAAAQPVLTVVARSALEGVPRAWVGTRTGLLAVDGSCGGGPIDGLPEGAYVATLSAIGDEVLALATGPVAGGVYRCGDEGCRPTDLVRDGLFPKSITQDGGRWWVTTVDADTLAARLWWSDDAQAWAEVVHGDGALWPDGDLDVRLLEVEGERLLAWGRTRRDADVPRLLRSVDRGGTWVTVLEHGSWQDAAPGFARTGSGDSTRLWLGSSRGARTWSSDDDGRTWTELSLEVPALRCAGVAMDGTVWGCADHLADGFDLAVFEDDVWRPAACVSEVATAACDEGTCDGFLDLYEEAALVGGASCSVDAAPPAPSAPCGCASDRRPSSWLLACFAALVLVTRRR